MAARRQVRTGAPASCSPTSLDQFDKTPEADPPPKGEAAQLFLMVSSAASSVQPFAQTLQFRGTIFGKDVLILVDSGSAHSFLGTRVAQFVPGAHPLPAPVHV
jgi:hypothetical protein